MGRGTCPPPSVDKNRGIIWIVSQFSKMHNSHCYNYHGTGVFLVYVISQLKVNLSYLKIFYL